MSMTKDQVRQAFFELSPDDQADVLDALILSLEPTPALDAELARRSAAVRDDPSLARPLDEVAARLKRKYAQ